MNVPANENIWFVVDMQQARSVNYFRIKHTSRRNGDLVVRWRYFVDILGSNTPDDGDKPNRDVAGFDFRPRNHRQGAGLG